MTTNMQRMHGLIEQLAGRFKGYLPWPEDKRDAVVRGHEMFIEDTITKADALALQSEMAEKNAAPQADGLARRSTSDPDRPAVAAPTTQKKAAQVPPGVCPADDPNREAQESAASCSPLTRDLAQRPGSDGERGDAVSVSDDRHGTRTPDAAFSPDKLQNTPRVVAHPDKDADLFLCCADGEGTHEFKVCRGYDGVAAFYEAMCGRDADDTLDSLKCTFDDPDEWRNDGTALKLELYCAKFYVWKVSAAELAMPGCVPSATTPTITPELWSKLHLALGAAREYPDFDAGSPIRDYCDEALAELDRIAPEVLMRSRYVLRNTPDA